MLVACMAAVTVVVLSQSGSPTDGVSIDLGSEDPDATEVVENTESDALAPPPTKDQQTVEPKPVNVTISTLEAWCPDVHEEMSDECFALLEQYFLNSVIPEYAELTITVPRRVERTPHPTEPNVWIETISSAPFWNRRMPLTDAPTFDFAFSDPNTHRLQVLAALENEECRVSGGAIRHELHDTCNADSFVAVAVFLDVCQHYELLQISELRPQGRNDPQNSYQQELQWIEEDDFDSFEIYQRAREEVLERSFRDAWVVRKCSGFDDELFTPMGVLSPPGEGIQRYGRADFRNATSNEVTSAMMNWANKQALKDLFAIATRLGHPWAWSHYRFPFPDEDPDFWESLRVHSPLVYHMHMYKTKAVEIDKKERLKHAILAHAQAKAMELPRMDGYLQTYDPQLLKTHLDEIGPYTLEQLREAYAELDLSTPIEDHP